MTPENEADIRIITDSKLFDHKWYLKTYPDVAKVNTDPVLHYVLWGANEFRNPCPTFSTQIYLKNVKPDVLRNRNAFAHFLLHGTAEQRVDRGMLGNLNEMLVYRGMEHLARFPLYSDADYQRLNLDIEANIKKGAITLLNHAFAYGISEGRHIFSKRRIAQVLGDISRRPFEAPQAVKAPPAAALHVGVYFNRSGNTFIKEIAEGLVEALRLNGQEAELHDDHSDQDERPPCSIIVAPHEFFHIGKGRSWISSEFVGGAIMFNTEQPQTMWFDRAMPFILMSRGVIDISYQVAEMFRQSGLPAMHFDPNVVVPKRWLLPGDETHPLVRVLPATAKKSPARQAPFASRPIDIAFFGNSSAHRDKFFARSAKFLAEFDNFLYYRRFSSPLNTGQRDGILTRLGAHVAGHAKVWLNIHRDDYGFFEWHRIVQQGMVGGSIVVTEPTLPHPVYKPGVHFFEETGRHIPNLLEWLLRSSDGLAAAARMQSAISGIADRKSAVANGRKLVDFMNDVRSNAA